MDPWDIEQDEEFHGGSGTSKNEGPAVGEDLWSSVSSLFGDVKHPDRVAGLTGVFLCAIAVVLIARRRKVLNAAAQWRTRLRLLLYSLTTMASIGLLFVLLGFGIGYSTGYGERVAVATVNHQVEESTTLYGHVFWSLILSASSAFFYNMGVTCCLP